METEEADRQGNGGGLGQGRHRSNSRRGSDVSWGSNRPGIGNSHQQGTAATLRPSVLCVLTREGT